MKLSDGFTLISTPDGAPSPGGGGVFDNDDDWRTYGNVVRDIESKGDYGVMGGANNHYAGAYQMGSAAIKDAARILGEPVPSTKDFLRDPEMQDRYFRAYTQANDQYLTGTPEYDALDPRAKLEVLGYAHNQGHGGAKDWLRTGNVGADAFGTRGTKYSDALSGAWGSAPPAQPTVGAGALGQPTEAGAVQAEPMALGPMPDDDIGAAVQAEADEAATSPLLADGFRLVSEPSPNLGTTPPGQATPVLAKPQAPGAPLSGPSRVSPEQSEGYKPNVEFEGGSWADAAGTAVSNLGGSAGDFYGQIVDMVTDPIGTAKGIYGAGMGVAAKMGLAPEEYEKNADAIIAYYKQKYGSLEAAKEHFAEHPVDMFADIGTALAGIGGGLRVAGRAGQVVSGASRAAQAANPGGAVGALGRGFQAAGTVVDPIAGPIAAGKSAAGAAGISTLGKTTGAGTEAVREAYQSGVEGGARGRRFRDNIRGNEPIANVSTQAENAVRGLRAERSAQQSALRAQAQPAWQREAISPAEVDDLIFGASGRLGDDIGRRGQGWTDPATGQHRYFSTEHRAASQGVRDEVRRALDEWEMDPSLHNVDGLDALKQRLYSIADAEAFGSPARRVGMEAWGAVRDRLRQVPGYDDIMGGYDDLSRLIDELNAELSTGSKNPTKKVGTVLRKLQSAVRNNANTTWGRRFNLVQELEQRGADNLVAALSGQGMSDWTARGIQGGVLGAGLGTWATAGFAGFDPVSAALGFSMQSPRIVGESLNKLGAGSRIYRRTGAPRGRNVLRAGNVTQNTLNQDEAR